MNLILWIFTRKKASQGINSFISSMLTYFFKSFDFFQKRGKIGEDKLEKIFYELDKNNDQLINKNEYIRSCLEIEDLLKTKISQNLESLREYKVKHDEAVRKLQEAKVLALSIF